jgi:hypothetical protein
MRSRTLISLVVALAWGRSGFALDVTTCNTIVPAGEVAVLQADLSCAGAFVGVALGEGATLDLNGHAITGTFTPDPPRAVECRGMRCAIGSSSGVGRIGGGDFIAISIGLFTENKTRLRISDVELHDARSGIRGAAFFAYPRRTKVRAERVVSRNHTEHGIWVAKLTATDVDASGNGGPGIAADKIRASDVTASDNGAAGLFGERISVAGLVANDNGDAGVRAVKASLRDATLLGNDGLDLGVDVATVQRPRVVNTICGKSQVLGGVAGETWGICSGD